MDYTFTVNMDRKSITTSNRDDEHSLYLWNKYFKMLQREERCNLLSVLNITLSTSNISDKKYCANKCIYNTI